MTGVIIILAILMLIGAVPRAPRADLPPATPRGIRQAARANRLTLPPPSRSGAPPSRGPMATDEQYRSFAELFDSFTLVVHANPAAYADLTLHGELAAQAFTRWAAERGIDVTSRPIENYGTKLGARIGRIIAPNIVVHVRRDDIASEGA